MSVRNLQNFQPLRLATLGLCNYQPAVLKHYPSKNIGWTIEFFIFSPEKNKYVRYRFKVNRLRQRFPIKSEFLNQVGIIVNAINTRLMNGWKPEPLTADGYTPAFEQLNLLQAEASERYGANVEQPKAKRGRPRKNTEETALVTSAPAEPAPTQVPAPAPAVVCPLHEEWKGLTLEELIDKCLEDKKKKGLRPDTMRSYTQFGGELKAFVQERFPGILASDFKKYHAQAYIDYKEEAMRQKKNQAGAKYGVSDRSINNQIKGMRMFFAWGVEKDFIDSNPFQLLKVRPVHGKRRTIIDGKALAKINKYLRESNDKGFLLVCMLIHSGLIRPKEIRQLRIKDIHMAQRCIIVPPEVSKNHCERTVGITPEIIELLLDMNIGAYPTDYYIVGKGFIPSKTQAIDHAYRVRWEKLRDELGLPVEMQLYSLKDTGITTMLANGTPIYDVLTQAGHHDPKMTMIYAQHADPRHAQKMYENALSFGQVED